MYVLLTIVYCTVGHIIYDKVNNIFKTLLGCGHGNLFSYLNFNFIKKINKGPHKIQINRTAYGSLKQFCT